jgi:hypothetical protein
MDVNHQIYDPATWMPGEHSLIPTGYQARCDPTAGLENNWNFDSYVQPEHWYPVSTGNLQYLIGYSCEI